MSLFRVDDDIREGTDVCVCEEIFLNKAILFLVVIQLLNVCYRV